MILQTGGLACGATSTRSSSLSSDTLKASSRETIPICLPSGDINLTSLALIRSLILKSLLIDIHLLEIKIINVLYHPYIRNRLWHPVLKNL
jgi:hypothetical protein